MSDDPSRDRSAVTRRTALAGMGAGSVGLAFAGARRATAAQDDPAASLQTESGVVYGTVAGVELVLDVVRPPARPGPRPAVVVIHGGGLVEGTRWDLGEAAMGLALAGYATFSVEYRRFGQADGSNPWPAQLDDVQRAVRWVRANAASYGVDPERIGALGYSAGGQLAAFLGTRETRDNGDAVLAGFSSKVACAVTMGGLFDFTFPNAHPNADELDAGLLGGSPEALPDAAAYRDFSPIAFVGETSAPLLILQEGSEEIIPYEHGRRMVASLQEARAQVSYGWFPEYVHDSWQTWGPEAAETLAFFGRHLRPEEA